MEFKKINVIFICFILSITFVVNFAYKQITPQEFLDAHNPFRVEVRVKPLKWNTTLAAYAQARAIKLAKHCNAVYSVPEDEPYGENIAKSTSDLTAKGAVDMWLEERKHYDYDSNSCVGQPCGNYTQVVWGNSRSVGCGKAQCKNGRTLVICNYYIRGNLMGDVPYFKTLPNYFD